MAEIKRRTRVIIAGGGVGGLAAAAALRKAGAEPVVLEQAPELTAVGAGVNISANGMKALKYLGADTRIRETCVLSEGGMFSDLESGQELGFVKYGAEAATAWNESFYHVHRADLLDALLEVVDGDDLRLGRTVVGLVRERDSVRVQLDDGEEVVGDVLIGADGIRSTVRTALFGESTASETGYVAWRSLIPTDGPHRISDRPIARGWFGPRRHIVFYPVSGGRLLNFVGFVPSGEVARRESWTTSGDVEELRRSFAGSCEDVNEILNAIDEAYITAIYFREPLEAWGEGNVTLLGDAAHPVPPAAAQGACMALEDAVMLGRVFEQAEHTDVESALRRYESLRIPRTNRLFGVAMSNFRTFNQSDPLKIHGRNGRFKGLERLDPLNDAIWGWLYRYDAVEAADNTEAVESANHSVSPRRPQAQAAFDQWRGALLPTDFAEGEVGLRAGYDRFMREVAPATGSATTVEVDCEGVRALQIMPAGVADGPVVLHLHGGLFTMGSAEGSVGYAERMAREIGGWALAVDYSLAPEHEYPCALDEAVAALRWLRSRPGDDPTIIVSGHDAGANLALGVALWAAEKDAGAIDGLFLVSPFCDLALNSQSLFRNASTDPWAHRLFVALQAASYIHAQDPADPRISPIRADLRGLPPMVIAAAAGEALADDATRLAAAATEAGVDVQLTMVEDSVPSFTLFASLPETERAMADLRRLAGSAAGVESPS